MSAIEPTPEQLAALQDAAAGDDGPVVMLNLLRFRDRAVGIDAADAISGADDPEYVAIHAHRAAGVADSRLIACSDLTV